MPELLTVTPAGLFCERGGFHVDPVGPVPFALLTHAHADHAHLGSGRYLCAAPGLALARKRLSGAPVEGVPYGVPLRLGEATVSLHPAGHVLGSAQVRVEAEGGEGEVWVFSGDYKRQGDPTCAPFEPVLCDTFLTEATFGLPVYRWDPAEAVFEELWRWWEAQRAQSRAAVLFCYTLGKAQRVLAGLQRFTDRTVYVHGAIEEMTRLYREAGVRLLPTERVVEQGRGKKLAGELVLAPLSARGSPFLRRLGDWSEALASGWMRIRGERRRRSFDRGFALSDHADFPALVETVRATGARRVLVTHGHAPPFARYLRELGMDAAPLLLPSVGP